MNVARAIWSQGKAVDGVWVEIGGVEKAQGVKGEARKRDMKNN